MLVLASQASWSKDGEPCYRDLHDPSPDSVLVDCKVSMEEGMFTVTAVDTIAGKSAEQLYSAAKMWIGSVYNDPKTVIKSENPPMQLIFEGQLCGMMHGKLEMRFKDGRIRWKLYNICTKFSPVLAQVLRRSGDPAEKSYLYANFDRSSKWLLADLYEFITNFRKGMNSNDDDW